jgi:hypothetical protein
MMHEFWFYPGRFYKVTEDTFCTPRQKSSDLLKKNEVFYCIESKNIGHAKYALIENVLSGKHHLYQITSRISERLPFVAVNPSTL